MPFSLPLSIRRDLARISVTVVPGVSSIMMSKAERSVVAPMIWLHWFPLMRAPLMSEREILAWAESNLCAISIFDISSEKKATDAPLAAALKARFRANEVLPTPGRAPTTIIWPGRRP